MQLSKVEQWYGMAFFMGNLCFWLGYGYPYWLLLALYLIILYSFTKHRLALALFVLLGFGLPLLNELATTNITQQIKTEHKYLISGHITSWVTHDLEKSRFTFQVTKINHQNVSPVKLELRCYPACPSIHLGEKWQLLVKLKPPHGLANSVGFDYERWLFSRDVSGIGYISPATLNKQLGYMAGITQIRYDMKQRLLDAFYEQRTQASVMAMLLGDRSLLTDGAIQQLRATGTAHLIAISGLHVGLAGGFGFGVGMFLWRLLSYKQRRVDMLSVAWSVAMFSAMAYACISGFAIPAQRALCMLAVFALGHMFNRKWSLGQRFNLAVFCVLLLQPKAPLDVAFWLSFVVTAILIVYQKVLVQRSYWCALLMLQAVLFVCLLALQSLVFKQVALSSVLFNLWAIPWISLVVLPLSIIWLTIDLLLMLMSSSLDTNHLLTWLVDSSYRLFWWGLHNTSLPNKTYVNLSLAFTALIIIPVSVLVLRLSQSLNLRLFFIALVLLCFYPRSQRPDFKMRVLDVGQGLAILISSESENMLYDTGYGDNKTSRVASVIKPYLEELKVSKLQTVVISHDDNDHAGGLGELLVHFPIERLVIPNGIDTMGQRCQSGMKWQVGAASFRVLSPDAGVNYQSDNNNSCVVFVEIHQRRILLTGDIEYAAERTVLKNNPNLRADILLVPHHGSSTSSSSGFIEQIRPQIAINSSGYLNRFNLPNTSVVNRYKRQGINFYDTQTSGELEITINSGGKISISAYRQQNPALWRRNCYISQNYFVIQNERNLIGC